VISPLFTTIRQTIRATNQQCHTRLIGKPTLKLPGKLY
jgi:hypothetical protein